MLPFALNSGVQFSQVTKESAYAGATYERNWLQLGPDKQAHPGQVCHGRCVGTGDTGKGANGTPGDGKRRSTPDSVPEKVCSGDGNGHVRPAPVRFG